MAELSEEDLQGITGGALLINPQVLRFNGPIPVCSCDVVYSDAVSNPSAEGGY
jgi:bacteriocin-like protein